MKTYIIQEPTRLSESFLWELQYRAYTEFGPEAWREKGVPFYATSNPLIAQQYASMILGYLRDLKKTFDFDHPLYLFDLGAGTGKLAYLILKELLPNLKMLFSDRVKIRYVMTDVVEKNIHSWKEHPYFQEYMDQSVLDFAYYYHAEREKPIKLLHSDEVIENTVNPVVLICNYFFDTIPQDLFRIEKNQLQEGKVILSTTRMSIEDVDIEDPSIISELEIGYLYEPIEAEEYYSSEPDLNQLLKRYQELFSDATFLFPSEPIRTIRRFAELSKGRVLLLAGDQGYATEQQVRRWEEPKIAFHASFSMEVSYHALSEYFNLQGGIGLTDPLADPFFVNFLGVLGGEGKYPETQYAFHEQIEAFGSGDYSRIPVGEDQTLDSMLLRIKLGRYDPILFYEYFEKILKSVNSLTKEMEEKLVLTIHKVWDQYFPTCHQEGDFIMNLGVLLFQMRHFEEAKLFFERAIEIGGDQPHLQQNLLKCDYMIQQENSSSS